MIFFFYRLTCSYRFMFFFIDWKLPPPACPGTTGIYGGDGCQSTLIGLINPPLFKHQRKFRSKTSENMER